MKKVALILGLFLISFGITAQERDTAQKKSITKRSDLKGPAYKNYKPWQYKTQSIALYTNNSKKSLIGPEYKNYKPWKDTSKKEEVLVKIGNNERQKLKGPAYKNYKPWKTKSK